MRSRPPARPLCLEVLESRDTPAGLSPEVADNVVTGLYHQMLHRDPDAGGLAAFSQQLENGVPIRRVINRIWNSTEFRTLEVTNYYETYLGRTPAASEVNGWIQVLNGGTPEATVMGSFLASPEYATLHPTSADYAASLYRVLLEREPDAGGLAATTNALDAGAPRAAVADLFLSTNEFRRDRIVGLYEAVLGRPADPAGVRSYLALWRQPGITIRNVEIDFLASAENVANLTTLAGVGLASPLVTEYQLTYTTGKPSTHEILEDPAKPDQFWITGQLHDALMLFNANDGTSREFRLTVPGVTDPLGPHGMVFDDQGRFFVSLEFAGLVAQVDSNTGEILRTIDVRLNNVPGAPLPINTSPHDIALGADGETIWFTGKATGTVGKINPDGSINHYQLKTVGSVPIYMSVGPDGNIWGTELVGNTIFRVTDAGVVTEFTIPTFNSRPIVIIPDPLGRDFMWFSEENGHKVARISTTDGTFAEFAVPKTQSNMILAGMGFDENGNLYTQSYVDQNNPVPAGPDFIVKLSREVLTAAAGDLSDVVVTRFQVPSTKTIFHRINPGSDGNMYFTELGLDKAGRLLVEDSQGTPQGFQFDFGI